MVRTVIIDNERSSRRVLQQMLKNFCDDVEVTAVAEDMATGFVAIKEQYPDIVFVNAELPQQQRDEFIRSIEAHKVTIVLVTVEEFYKAVAKSPNVDVLLKPYNPSALKAVIQKADALKTTGRK